MVVFIQLGNLSIKRNCLKMAYKEYCDICHDEVFDSRNERKHAIYQIIDDKIICEYCLNDLNNQD